MSFFCLKKFNDYNYYENLTLNANEKQSFI